MAYFLSSLVAISAAIIIFLARYEADDSTFMSNLGKVEKSFLIVNQNYIPHYDDLTTINFATLYANDILPANIMRENLSGLSGTEDEAKKSILEAFQNENITEMNKYFKTVLTLPNSKELKYILVPIVDGDKNANGTDISKASGTGYKIFVDFSDDKSLFNKSAFTENRYKEMCQNELFGDFFTNVTEINNSLNFTTSGDKNDGKFGCIVYK